MHVCKQYSVKLLLIASVCTAKIQCLICYLLIEKFLFLQISGEGATSGGCSSEILSRGPHRYQILAQPHDHSAHHKCVPSEPTLRQLF